MMTRNMGNLDRGLRFLFALIIGVLYWTDLISGTLALVLGIIALVLLLTSLIGFCPLYAPFGLSTLKKQR